MSADLATVPAETSLREETRTIYLTAIMVVVAGTLAIDPSRLILILIPTSFLLAAFGAGELLERALGPLVPSPLHAQTLLPIVTRIGVGIAILGFLATIMGLSGGYWGAGWITGLLAMWAALTLLRTPNLFRLFHPNPLAIGSGLMLGAMWLVVWLWATIPATFYDELAYHLPIPQHALRTGSLAALPWSFFTFMPHASDLLLGWGLALAGDRGAHALHIVFWVMTWLAAWTLVETIGLSTPGAWRHVALAGALSSSSTFLFLGALPFAETSLAMAVVLGTALVAAARGPCAPWLAVGLLWGLASTVKLSGLSWVVAQAVAAALVGWPRKHLLWAGTVALASTLPWLCRAWWLTGNPFYPMGYQWLGGRYWNDESQAKLRGDLPSLAEGTNPLDWLRLPYDMIVSPERFGSASDAGALAVLSVCLVMTLPLWSHNVGAGERHRCLRYAAASFMIIAGAMWIATSTTTRFFAPALVLSLAVLVVLMTHLPASLRTTGALGLGLLGLWGISGFLVQHTKVFGSAHIALGRESPAVYLSRSLEHYDAARYVGAHVAHAGRVLFIGETRPFHFERESLAPYPFHSHPLAQWVREAASTEGLKERIRMEGFTHVVLNTREFKRLHDQYRMLAFNGPDAAELDRRLKELPRVLTPLFAKNSVFVFQVASGPLTGRLSP